MKISRQVVAPRFCIFLLQDIARALGMELHEYLIHIVEGLRK